MGKKDQEKEQLKINEKSEQKVKSWNNREKNVKEIELEIISGPESIKGKKININRKGLKETSKKDKNGFVYFGAKPEEKGGNLTQIVILISFCHLKRIYLYYTFILDLI